MHLRLRHAVRCRRERGELTLPLLRRDQHLARPAHLAALRLGLDFALFTSVLLAWPVLRLALLLRGRRAGR